jgi:hypothetical protein
MTYPIVLESIINIVLAVIVYKYLDNLKKIQCTCALTDNRKYIMYYLLASVLISVLYPIVYFFSKKNSNILQVFLYIYGIVSLVSFLFSIYAFQYIHKLREDNCTCSDSIVRDMYYYYLIVSFSMLCIGILFGAITYFGFLKDLKKTYPRKRYKRKVR